MTNRAGWMTWLMMTVGALISVPATAADGSLASDATAMITTAPRRIIVSIADRRLVVVENDEILAAFPVAVGAPTSPSPVGTFTVINRVINPTYYRPGTVIAPGPRNPIGTRWDRPEPKRLRHPRDRRTELYRLREVAPRGRSVSSAATCTRNASSSASTSKPSAPSSDFLRSCTR
jgi:hypothetical protein